MSCEKSSESDVTQETPIAQEIDMSDFYLYTEEEEFTLKSSSDEGPMCGSMIALNRQLQENPRLYNKMYTIELYTRRHTSKANTTVNSKIGDVDVPPIEDGLGIINLPVYIHIVYPDANSAISDAQVTSQMNVLNSDFRDRNIDQLPSLSTFANDATDAGFSFSLAGVFRHNNPTIYWGTKNLVKILYPPITPETHLNIWVCKIGEGILGLGQFPGGDPSTDGILVSGENFGFTDSENAGSGRIAIHEIGHYLNLRHIWGDGACRKDDFVTDTPTASGPYFGCPRFPSMGCRSADMTMNYMDYTYDACKYMFTDGQRNRMRALFTPGGIRESMIK